MSSDRSPPLTSSPREGVPDQMVPQPSSSPRSGRRNPTQHFQNQNENTGIESRKLVNLNPVKCRIFYVNSTPASSLASLNGFVIKKAISGFVGTDHKCTRLRSGTLRVEVNTQKQAEMLLKMAIIQYVPVQVTPPFASNTSKGVVTHYDFVHMTEEEIVQEMEDLDVVACKKFTRFDKVTKERKPSDTVCLTFATTNHPESILVGYEPRKVRTFIPRPLRCSKCQL